MFNFIKTFFSRARELILMQITFKDFIINYIMHKK